MGFLLSGSDACWSECNSAPSSVGVQRFDNQFAPFVAGLLRAPDLYWLALQLAGHAVVEGPVQTGDRNQFGIEAGTEDACVGSPAGTGQCAPRNGA